ncbi:MAG: phage portal protein [Flavobacteriales bacterium]
MANINILDARGRPIPKATFTGGTEGFGGELARWTPPLQMDDAALLPHMQAGNARADDLTRNHGIASGGVQLHVDNIVGHYFRLSAKPLWRRLGISEADARLWSADVEAAFYEYAEDTVNCWIDAEQRRTFTMIIREAVATHTRSGEAMAVAEYVTRQGTPLKTCVKMINPNRVSNPGGLQASRGLRGGVKLDKHGASIGYYIREPEYIGGMLYNPLILNGISGNWQYVKKKTQWGRLQFLHVFEPTGDGNTRGTNQFFSVMSRLKMLDRFQTAQLQNAIVNAMYAAIIKTDLGGDQAFDIISGGDNGDQRLKCYLNTIQKYHEAAKISFNGVKIPHLMPGEDLDLLTPGNSAQGFAEFESAILRYIAAGLNVSYEQLARDYSKTNYSSARASMLETWRYMLGRRKVIASRLATMIYSLVLEELLDKKIVTLPKKSRFSFYEASAAWCNANWIGSGRSQIDGLKEVKEAVLKIEHGLSTYEKELANMGEDYQEIFMQQVRETKERQEAGLPPPSWVRTLQLDEQEGSNKDEL